MPEVLLHTSQEYIFSDNTYSMHAMSLYFGGNTASACRFVSLAHYDRLSRTCKFCTGAYVLLNISTCMLVDKEIAIYNTLNQ